MKAPLYICDGRRQLPEIARALPDDDLAWWIARIADLGSLPHELGILVAEQRRRGGPDADAGPLFRADSSSPVSTIVT